VTQQHLDDKDGEPLEAHHLYCRARYPDKETDANNDVLIKRSIHIKFHQLYGFTDITPDMFEQFLRDHYNIYSYPWRNANYN
jgi:hypothetical protein